MTNDQLAQSLRQIADHAVRHLEFDGAVRMQILLSPERVADIRRAADALDGGRPVGGEEEVG